MSIRDRQRETGAGASAGHLRRVIRPAVIPGDTRFFAVALDGHSAVGSLGSEILLAPVGADTRLRKTVVTPDAVQRKLAALLSADVVGYSCLMAKGEAATLKTLNFHRDVMGALVRQHAGRVVNAVGDNVLAEFPSVVDAVACAIKIQEMLAERNTGLTPEQQMQFRIGINLGDVMVSGDDVYGDGVNIAARLEALAEAGGICISGTVYEHIRQKLEVECEDLGEQHLKNIANPIRVYRVRVTEGEKGDNAAALTVPGFAGRPAIAVLAFDNLSGDPDQEYLADGIAEDMITRLSAFRLFPMIARNSSFTYKGKAVDVKRVSRELGVRYVVEGSVRKAGDQVRISAQLIDATTGHHIWADRYDRKLCDIFALQDEITETLIGSLEPTLEKTERQRAIRKAPENLNAWDCVQRGTWHLFRQTKEDLRKARSLFHTAGRLAPHFSPAFSGLARSHYYEAVSGWSGSPTESLADALQAAEKSVALDEDDPLAHFVLGMACFYAQRHERAMAAQERAIGLNPSFAWAYLGLGQVLAVSGRLDDGLTMIQKAIRLSPHDPLMHIFFLTLAWGHFFAKRYADAVQWARKSIQARADNPSAYRLLATSYGHLGQLEEASAALGEFARLTADISVRHLELFLPTAMWELYLDGLRKAGWKE